MATIAKHQTQRGWILRQTKMRSAVEQMHDSVQSMAAALEIFHSSEQEDGAAPPEAAFRRAGELARGGRGERR